MAGRMNKAEHDRIREEVFKYHAMRKSNRDIADLVGVSHVTVANMIKESYRIITLPLVEEALKQDLELIAQTITIAAERYESTKDPADYGALQKMLDHRAKLLGMFAPEKRDITANVYQVTQDDLEIIDLLNVEKMKNASTLDELKIDSEHD